MIKVTVLMLSCLSLFFMGAFSSQNSNVKKDTALLIIDVQNFYFPGGSLELVHPEKAAEAIGKVLAFFREQNITVIYITHNVKKGGAIYSSVKPLEGEKIISKDYANCFRDTELLPYLDEHGIKNLVFCGMQTHMCLEAGVRAGADIGFKCTVIEDGCATRDLTYNGRKVEAEDVQASTMAALNRTYASICTADEYIRIHK